MNTSPQTTNWIWSLHADAHDFRAHDSRLHLLSARIFASHFGHLGLVFLWMAGMYFAGARTSNYVAWLADPVGNSPGAQPTPRTVPGLPMIVQDVTNADLGGGFASLQLTSGLFHCWRVQGFVTGHQLLSASIASVWLATLCFFGDLCLTFVFMSFINDIGVYGVSMSSPLKAHRLEILNAWHVQLAWQLAIWGSLSIWFGHLVVSFPAYPFLANDFATSLSLFTHHQWIGGFFIVGAAAHASMGLLYDTETRTQPVVGWLATHKRSIIVHLNWVCIFLGVHSFGLYVHNDTLQALGRPADLFSDQGLVLLPLLAQWVQVHVAIPVLVVVGDHVTSRVLGLGTADFLVHHVHAFTVHVTALILLKGSLYARSSRLVPDKRLLGFRFPCDGPGRGGTWQVSAWDHVFLGLFWMYNAISVIVFHFSWKVQSDVWAIQAGNGFRHITARNFASCSTTINGWLRDFLWSQSSQVIQSYGSATSVYGLMFLGAHFIWAFSLMFLFSGRGYWQELIEAITWAHAMVLTAPALYPRALSIVQGRAVGVAHYLLGGIVTTWAFFEARSLGVG